jgi:CDP-glycerol glycerophosphotransferase (TagB/SpsB family)
MLSPATRAPDAARAYRRLARRAAARTGWALQSAIAIPVRAATRHVTRDPSLIAFGAGANRYADNARYAFAGVSRETRLRCVWITGDRRVRDEIRALGYEAELRWSVPGIRCCLRAGWYVYGAYVSDISYLLGNGARTFNLWHGIPLKAIEFDITTGPLAAVYHSPRWSPLRLAFADRFLRPDVVLSTSEFVTQRCFSSAFRIPAERCLEFGYPRTDHFCRPDASAIARRRLDLPDGATTVVGYFPTWRDDGRDFLSACGFSFDELNDALVEGDKYLLFKSHPNFADIAPRDRQWSNIRIVDGSVDAYEILPACDALITDYSSIAYDFLLLDRPIVYFVPDLDRYVEHRNVYFTLEEMAAGPIVTQLDELYRLLSGPVPPIDPERNHALRQLLWNGYDGHANAQIARYLVDAIDAPADARPPFVDSFSRWPGQRIERASA